MECWTHVFTLLLIELLILWHDSEAYSVFTIDQVHLTIQPGNTVDRGTSVILVCKGHVSSSSPQLLRGTFEFLRNDEVVHSVNTTRNEVELKINPARVSNSGFYECSVRIEDRFKKSNPEKLIVQGLQVPKLTVNKNHVYEGDDVSVSCSAVEESGPLQFYFFKDGKEIKMIHTSTNTANTSITIEREGETYLYCQFSVKDHPQAGISMNSTAVKIIATEIKITPELHISPNENIFEGDNVTIQCDVIAKHSHLALYLSKQSKILNKAKTGFSYYFRPRAEDSGEYVCKSELGALQKSTGGIMRVKELFSKPNLIMSPKDVFEGDGFSVQCASTPSEKITNRHIKYSICRDNKNCTVMSSQNITAGPTSNGNYSCKAEANGIIKTSSIFSLSAKVPVSVPVIRTTDRVIVGKPFQVVCESENGTLPIQYSLVRHGMEVYQYPVHGPHRRALFNVTSISRKAEIRDFTCKASNGRERFVKESSRLNAVVIEPVSKPALTLNTEGRTITEGTELVLTCSVQAGTTPITFTWFHSGTTAPLDTKQSSVTSAVHTIQSTTRDQRGRYHCTASNEASESKSSSPVTIGVNLAGWKKVVIAVFCIVLLVAIMIALILIMKKKYKPRRGKRASELSVKPVRSKSGDPMRVSLTLDAEDNIDPNATPGVMGRNVWSDHVSSSGSDEQSSGDEYEKSRYAEVAHPQGVDHTKAPLKKGTDTVYSEVQENTQEASEHAEGVSLEYAQLNHNEQESE
ncbi:platelet endothelial cell adhesion molecule [Chanos chanos]|uniref:Platelet endothelial cell adhesion molecule n=1 Tax=Chanos chanos TaxID=29144 RepID=A0A6J2WKZ2_CHACN|nr:platelet endothelial cell adhesion molecule-like [Chanos chanos]